MRSVDARKSSAPRHSKSFCFLAQDGEKCGVAPELASRDDVHCSAVTVHGVRHADALSCKQFRSFRGSIPLPEHWIESTSPHPPKQLFKTASESRRQSTWIARQSSIVRLSKSKTVFAGAKEKKRCSCRSCA